MVIKLLEVHGNSQIYVGNIQIGKDCILRVVIYFNVEKEQSREVT